jgi:hypothetical protein
MRIFWSPILDFFQEFISLQANKCFLEKKFFDPANIGGVTIRTATEIHCCVNSCMSTES